MKTLCVALANWMPVTEKRALVLAGGGLAGIAWEIGVLRGIADEAVDTAQALLDSDVLLGTSAGSTVAAQLGKLESASPSTSSTCLAMRAESWWGVTLDFARSFAK